MARRDIRHMLMTPKNQIKERPWAVPALMALVLIAGLALGLGVGVLSGGKAPPNQAETVLDRPPRFVEDDVAPQLPDPQAGLLTPVPRARPGGPGDDGMPPEEEVLPEAPETEKLPGKVAIPDQDIAGIPVGKPIAAVPVVQAVSHAPLPKVAPPPGLPAWKVHALPAPKTGGRPMIAIVIDDMGIDRRRTERVMALSGPLTLSWLAYADDLVRQTQAAKRRGHELMLHVPMEPMAQSYDPGPDVLEVRLTADEIRRRLNLGLNRFDGFVGINNHMGSRFTAHAPGMEVVMQELGRRGLLFLDSVTTQKSVGAEVAQRHGIAFAARNVFLDNEQSVPAVKAQLAKLEAHALKHGTAIAIGHPYDSTIQALTGWMPGLAARGFVLVPVSAIVAKSH